MDRVRLCRSWIGQEDRGLQSDWIDRMWWCLLWVVYPTFRLESEGASSLWLYSFFYTRYFDRHKPNSLIYIRRSFCGGTSQRSLRKRDRESVWHRTSLLLHVDFTCTTRDVVPALFPCLTQGRINAVLPSRRGSEGRLRIHKHGPQGGRWG